MAPGPWHAIRVIEVSGEAAAEAMDQHAVLVGVNFPEHRPRNRSTSAGLGSAWRGGLVTHSGSRIEKLDDKIWAVPVDRLLV